jgi:predicted transcriptional regulator
MKTQVNASVKMPSVLHERVVSLAEARDKTPHALMLHAIESYVAREEKREKWRQEGIAAWEEYQRTGLHLTNAEVMAWLAELAKGNDVEPPKCHV